MAVKDAAIGSKGNWMACDPALVAQVDRCIPWHPAIVEERGGASASRHWKGFTPFEAICVVWAKERIASDSIQPSSPRDYTPSSRR